MRTLLAAVIGQPVQRLLQHDGDPLVEGRGVNARDVDAVPRDDAGLGSHNPLSKDGAYLIAPLARGAAAERFVERAKAWAERHPQREP